MPYRDPGSPKMFSWKLKTLRFGGDEGHANHSSSENMTVDSYLEVQDT